MNFWDFFKRNKKSEGVIVKTKKPSREQLLFSDTVLELVGSAIEVYGFSLRKVVVETYITSIVYRKDKRYIKVNSTTYPRDYPYCYNIVLGEGDSENFIESDWNSIALWALAKTMDTGANISSYNFPYEDKVSSSIKKASGDLLKYGESFLTGDLTAFYEARKTINQQREPYKIHLPDKNGNYKTIDDPMSVKQKRKYS